MVHLVVMDKSIDNLSAISPDSDFRFEIIDNRLHPEKRHTQYRIRVTIFPPGLLQPTIQIVCWKRFSEARTLYRQLLKLCEQLHLKERPPTLPDAPLFSRFESNVIAQRTEAIIGLLDFASKSPILAGSSVFVDFFKHGQRVTFEEHVPLQMPLFNSITIDSDFERSLQQYSYVAPKVTNPYMDDLMTLQLEPTSADNQHDTVLCVDQNVNGDFVLRHQDKVDNEDSASLSSPTHHLHHHTDSSASLSPDSSNDEPSAHTFLIDAATLISQAQSAETAGDYDVAFESYKCVIGILIEGVKKEANSSHATAIKHKIHQYLKRAEDIQRLHLASKIKTAKNFSLESPYRKVFASEIKLSNAQSLAKFKLLGVCNRVQIVFDSINRQKLALKLVHKFSDVPMVSQYVFPKDIPNMMQPLQIQASSHTFYLFFEYSSVFSLSDAIRVAGGRSEMDRDHKINAQLEIINQRPTSSNSSRRKSNNGESTTTEELEADGSESHPDGFGVSGLIRKARRLLLDVEQTMRVSRVEQERREEKSTRLHNQQLLSQVLQRTCPDRNGLGNREPRILFNESLVRQWMRQLIEGLQHLHRLQVIYVRLCPDKILLSEDLQQARLAYVWTLDKQQLPRPLSPLSLVLAAASERSNARCMPYLAPEVLTSHDEPGPEADWWSIGLIAYELLTNRHPSSFLGYTYDNELDLQFPERLSDEARDFISKCLKIDPSERMGCCDPEELATHPFFASM